MGIFFLWTCVYIWVHMGQGIYLRTNVPLLKTLGEAVEVHLGMF